MRSKSIGKVLALAGIATLALAMSAGGAAAGNGKAYGKLAAKDCAKQLKELGQQDFSDVHGKPAMPNCIGVVRGNAQDAAKNAAKECKAGGLKGKEFGKCVSGKVRSEVAEDRAETLNAAQTCKAERLDPSTIPGNTEGKSFEDFYGTNTPNPKGKGAGRNAFGKCVSSKAKANGTV